MLSIIDIEKKLKQIKPEISEKFHVTNIGYFGSYSKNQQNENSDLDILVEFSRPVGWEFFTLEQFLESKLGLRIDLVTSNALKDRIKEIILKEVKYI
ncbi:MAG: nucleotidyltransferase family protein [Chitinophagales bacterium]|nr:nucleotidyltransferase family protein [Bacteroidota bacterium]MBK8487689.1 nucleotidyltransferase family protein [Bacteroidota bacterium]MBK8682569.1 nucleotidyltransferase family protein [Bacteroidota bacterium]